MSKTIKYISIAIIILNACDNLPKLENSPLEVKDINDIGELVTSEYYGEVYRSLTSFNETNLILELKQDFIFFKDKYSQFSKESKKPKTIIRKFRQAGLLKDHRFNRLKGFTNESNMVFITDILGSKEWEDFNDTYNEELKKYTEKRQKKNPGEIVYLGRGWVKAGFDLTKIDFAKMVTYSSDTMFIKNLDPIILDTDINPWLVPGKIPGFEIIKMDRKVSLEDIQTVKIACKRGLKHSAIESGIYEYTISSGEMSLEGLFGLMEIPGIGFINKVVIIPTKYFEYKADIIKDGIIDKQEYALIKEIITSDTLVCDKEWFDTIVVQKQYLKDFIKEIYIETSGNDNSGKWISYCDSLNVFLE